MSERLNMEEIKNRVREFSDSEERASFSEEQNNEITEAHHTEEGRNLPSETQVVGVGGNFVSDRLSQIVFKSDSTKSVTEQIEEAAEVGATVKAVESEEIQEQMASAKGEQLVQNVRAKAADARAERVKAETEEQKAKREQNEAMLGIFNADKHYPEWFRKIVIIMFTPFYITLLLLIGVPTGILRFTLDCIDGILVRYENVDEKRKPKVRVTFWVILFLAVISAVVFPVLKYFKII